MPEENAMVPPKGFEYGKWTFGEAMGAPLMRKSQKTGRKHSVFYGEVKKLPLYDAPLNISEKCLPPSNVILSSELAYKVLRLTLTTGIFTLPQLRYYWPANWTVQGTPCEHIEPMGRAALVVKEDGSKAFGSYNGYIYGGSHAMRYAANQSGGDLHVVRQRKPWLKIANKKEGLATSDDFEPETYDPLAPINVGVHDPERMKVEDKWPPAIARECKNWRESKLAYKPGNQSPTHPNEQPYWNKANKKHISGINSWIQRRAINPLKPLPAIHIQDFGGGKKNAWPLPTETVGALNVIFKGAKLSKNALEGYTIMVIGTLAIFENQDDFLAWAKSHGASTVTKLGAGVTHLVTGDVEASHAVVKEARKMATANGDFKKQSERAFLDAIAQYQLTLVDSDISSVTPLYTNPITQPPTGSSKMETQPIHRIAYQHLAQTGHLTQLAKLDTYQRTDKELAQLETKLKDLSVLATLPSTSRTSFLQSLEEASELLGQSRKVLRDGYTAFMENMDKDSENFVAALNSVSVVPFTDEVRREAMAKGMSLPGAQIEDLKNPKAWYSTCAKGDMGLASDIENGATVAMDYQKPKDTKHYSAKDFDDHPWAPPAKKQRLVQLDTDSNIESE